LGEPENNQNRGDASVETLLPFPPFEIAQPNCILPHPKWDVETCQAHTQWLTIDLAVIPGDHLIIGVGIAIGIAAWEPGIMTMERRGRCAPRAYGNPKAPVPASMCQNPDVPA